MNKKRKNPVSNWSQKKEESRIVAADRIAIFGSGNPTSSADLLPPANLQPTSSHHQPASSQTKRQPPINEGSRKRPPAATMSTPTRTLGNLRKIGIKVPLPIVTSPPLNRQPNSIANLCILPQTGILPPDAGSSSNHPTPNDDSHLTHSALSRSSSPVHRYAPLPPTSSLQDHTPPNPRATQATPSTAPSSARTAPATSSTKTTRSCPSAPAGSTTQSTTTTPARSSPAGTPGSATPSTSRPPRTPSSAPAPASSSPPCPSPTLPWGGAPSRHTTREFCNLLGSIVVLIGAASTTNRRADARDDRTKPKINAWEPVARERV